MSEQRNAFIDSSTKVLKCHGFVEANEPGDEVVAVDEEFDREPGRWQLQAGEWIAYP